MDDFVTRICHSVSLVSLSCGIGNNAAWQVCLAAHDKMKAHHRYNTRVAGGHTVGWYMRKVLIMYHDYERRLLNADQNKLFDLHGQNIFFTLLLGYLAICAVEQWKSKHPLLLIPVLIGIMLAAGFGLVDYGVFGVAFIVVLYALRQNEFFRLFSAFLLGNSRFVMLAFLPMSLYNGKRGFIKGKFLKYAFYAIYPVHIFIIYLLKLHWGLFK